MCRPCVDLYTFLMLITDFQYIKNVDPYNPQHFSKKIGFFGKKLYLCNVILR